ncbi:MAG: SPASM domain-containing protein [Spirochaetes bacterium]|nr:SPASM domain-containing protein [Spirochaetota bacterium]
MNKYARYLMKTKENFFLVFRPENQKVSPRVSQVYLELSTHCNLSCRSCIRNTIVDFRKRHFTPALMKKVKLMLEALGPERIVLLGFGEALCNPHIRDHLRSLREIETKIVLVSNASFLTGEMSSFLVELPLDEIYVSWDDDIFGSDAAIRRGASADLFRRNIETLAGKKASAGRRLPTIGLQIVATRTNHGHMAKTIRYGHSIGIEQFIVSNLYPYDESMTGEILYDIRSGHEVDLRKLLRREIRKYTVRVAHQKGRRNRSCPFIEKGTIFITADGEIAPCPELAYTHPAYYSGLPRIHTRFILGSVSTGSLDDIWEGEAFTDLRNNFQYYDFPDCAYCYRPDMCYKRTVEGSDCYGNRTPCSECLWAKGIVICP